MQHFWLDLRELASFHLLIANFTISQFLNEKLSSKLLKWNLSQVTNFEHILLNVDPVPIWALLSNWNGQSLLSSEKEEAFQTGPYLFSDFENWIVAGSQLNLNPKIRILYSKERSWHSLENWIQSIKIRFPFENCKYGTSFWAPNEALNSKFHLSE